MSFALVRFALLAVLIISALISISSALLLLYGWTHNATVFQGVTSADVSLSGLNHQQATDRITSRIQTVAPKQIVLSYDGRNWSIPASTLGITYDPGTTAERALEVGHAGNLWTQSHDWLTTLSSGDDVPLAYTLNDQAAYTALQGLAGSVTRAAQNAGYVFTSDGTLAVDPGKEGVAIDVAATVRSIHDSVASLSSSPIEVKTVPVKPEIDANALQPGLKQANDMVSAPFVLADHGTKWAISPDTLREMLVVSSSSSGKDSVGLSSSALESYIAQIADKVHTNGQNAGVRVRKRPVCGCEE